MELISEATPLNFSHSLSRTEGNCPSFPLFILELSNFSLMRSRLSATKAQAKMWSTQQRSSWYELTKSLAMPGLMAFTLMKRHQQKSKTVFGVHGSFLVFTGQLLILVTSGSLNSSTNMGWYFWKITFVTSKVRSKVAILTVTCWLWFDIPAHVLILSKKSKRLRLLLLSKRVKGTPFP